MENLHQLLARSHVSLKGYLALQSALSNGRLAFRLRHCIAIFVAEASGSTYMLSACVSAARRACIDEDVIADARQGRAADARTDAILRFVDALVHAHGNVSELELARLRAVHVDDGEVVEIISNVCLRLFTSYAAICASLPLENEPVFPHVYCAPQD
jgi:alkylhydroperoxidase family enzyme